MVSVNPFSFPVPLRIISVIQTLTISLIIKSIDYYLHDTIVSVEDRQKEDLNWYVERIAEKYSVFHRHIIGF